ncbi:hypothetical protein DFAR_710025 [Desulfarculales bacterium]
MLSVALVWMATPLGPVINHIFLRTFGALILPVTMAANMGAIDQKGKAFGSFNT